MGVMHSSQKKNNLDDETSTPFNILAIDDGVGDDNYECTRVKGLWLIPRALTSFFLNSKI